MPLLRSPSWLAALALAAPSAAQHWFHATTVHDIFPSSYREAADLDGDGRVELLSLGNTSWSVHTIGAAGEPSLAATVALGGSISAAVYTPQCADFDGDGVTDVAWLRTSLAGPTPQHSLALYRGLGGLGFSAPIAITIPLRPLYATRADFDGDGRPDVAVLSRSDNGLQTRLGWYAFHVGAWSAAQVQVDDLSVAREISVLDYDADGRPDLVAPNAGVLRVYTTASGVPQWTANAALPSGMAQSNAHVRGGDWDGDGDLDALVYGGSSSSIQQPFALVHLSGASQLQVGTAHWLSIPFGVVDAAHGDWDGDGDLDVAIETRVYEHVGDNPIANVAAATGSFHPNDDAPVAVADVDGDGRADLLGVQWIRWGDASFAPVPTGPIGFGTSEYPSFLADVDDDGDLDGLASFPAAQIGAGAGWQAQPILLPAQAPLHAWRPIAACDFDGDAIPDLLAGDWFDVSGGTGPIWVERGAVLLRGDGLGRWPVADPAIAFADADGAAIGYGNRMPGIDGDNDGDLDVLRRRGFAWNAGDGTFPSVDALATLGIHDHGDFDGDGDADLVGWTSSSVGALHNWTQGPGHAYTTQPLATLPGIWLTAQATAGDLDADGDVDLVVVLRGASPSAQVLPLENVGGVLIPGVARAVDDLLDTPSPVFVLDADGDGLDDLLISSAGESRTYVLRRAGAGLAYEPARVLAVATYAAADFDRDGDVDLAGLAGAPLLLRNLAHEGPSHGLVAQYGTATAGTFGVAPVLGLGGLPQVGAPIELRLRQVSGSGPALVALSSAPAALVGVPFPSLTLALDPGGLGPPLGVGLLSVGGVAKWGVLPLLLSPSAAGADVYLQGFALDAGAPDLVSATRGLRVRIAQ